MSEINRINISTLQNQKNNFENEMSNFKHSTYTTFRSSYISSSSDNTVSVIKSKLSEIYKSIDNGYNKIYSWWNYYLQDIEGVEEAICNDGRGSIAENLVRNSVEKLEQLTDYVVELQTFEIEKMGALEFAVNATLQAATDGIEALGDRLTSAVTTIFSNEGLRNLFQNIEQDIIETKAIIEEKAIHLWNSVSVQWENVILPGLINAATTVADVLKRVGCTVGTFVVSLVEGIVQFGEALVDLVAILGTGIASIFTGIADGYQAVKGLITGEEWSSITKSMWNNGTMKFVSTQHATSWFDSFYETKVGSVLKTNAYFFDQTRSIGSGIGYIAGVVVLTIATFGVGGVVASGGTVSVSTAAAATSTTQMAITATAAGIGKGTQTAWSEGAELSEGLTAGILTGLWEGLQFFVGGKIGGLKVFGTDGVLKSAASGKFTTKFLNGFARIVLDGADSGVEGFAMPAINAIYKDGYYDENNNYIKFTDSDNIVERYRKLFDDNGGWSTVGTNAAVGLGGSFLGEIFDLNKFFRKSDESISTAVNNRMAKDKLIKIHPKLMKLYEEARISAKNLAFFLGFEEHNFLHVNRVADESVNVAAAISELIDNGKLNGYGKIDSDVLYKAGLAHDLGMKQHGFVVFGDKTMAAIDDIIENPYKYESQIRKTLDLDASKNLEDIFDLEGQLVRKYHPLNSAITVLQSPEVFGNNSEMVACLALIHSKSTSGVRNVDSYGELSKMVQTLYENQKLNGQQIYKFDASKIVECNAQGVPLTQIVDGNEVYIFKEGVVDDFRSGAVALRVGDAHAHKTGFNHNGQAINIKENPTAELTISNSNNQKLKSLCELEASNAVVEIGNKNSTQLAGGSYEYSKQIVLGESNAYTGNTYVDGDVLTYDHFVKTSNSPACTWKHGISEKIGEYATFKNIKQKMNVYLPENASDDLLEFYLDQSTAFIKNEKCGDWLEINIIRGR